MKKLIAMVLALASVLVIVCACAQNEEKKPTNSTGEDDKLWLDNLPEDLDLEGADIKFIVGEADPPQTLSARSIYVEEDDGDIVNSEIYNRNARIEERLNCTITLVDAIGTGMQADATPVLMAGDDDYDVLGGRQHDDIDICLDGYCLNLNTLSEYGADYIDISQPWWGTEYIDKMTYKDQLYWITGVLSLRYISGANCLYVNSELYGKYVRDKHGDLYEIVKSGKWTLDLMGEMAALAYVDQNGNDKSDKGDIFGLHISVSGDMVDALAYASGVHYSYETEDGTAIFNLSDTNADYINFMEKMGDIFMTKYSFHSTSDTAPSFHDGEILFRGARVQNAELDYREMEQDFYIVPLPKRDEASEYTTTIHDGNLLFAISYCTPQVAQSAAVLEAMAAESYRKVMPAYYDMALKYKYTRDDNAAEMIDLIRDSITTDFGFIWGRYVGCLYFTRGQLGGKVAGQLKKVQTSWQNKFSELIEKFDKLEEEAAKA